MYWVSGTSLIGLTIDLRTNTVPGVEWSFSFGSTDCGIETRSNDTHIEYVGKLTTGLATVSLKRFQFVDNFHQFVQSSNSLITRVSNRFEADIQCQFRPG